LQEVKIAISSLNCSLVEQNSFVALSGKELPLSDIDRGVGGSTCMVDYSEEREHGYSSCPCITDAQDAGRHAMGL
jgi:hypothetical protein